MRLGRYWSLVIPFIIGALLSGAVLLYMTRNRAPIFLEITPPENSRHRSYEVVFNAHAADPEGVEVQYYWDFGDGHTSAEQQPKHVYAQGGEYTVTLTVSDPQGARSTKRFRIYVNRPPQAKAVAHPFKDLSPLAVQFDGSSSIDSDSPYGLKYSWDFGDGTTSEEPKPIHQYLYPGEYEVTLVVTDVDGATDRTQMLVRVPGNQPPVARFQMSPMQPVAGDPVSFDAHASYDLDGMIVSYEWDFEGDGRVDASGIQVIHRFEREGQYPVQLTITDDQGATHSTSSVVQVVPLLPPTARFSFSPEVPHVNQVVRFDATASLSPQGRIVRYEWDLNGDGRIDEIGPYISHQFTSGGRHTITLIVTDQRGQQAQLSQIIEVNKLPIVRLTISKSVPRVHDSVVLDASGSYDPDGRIVEYLWDLDGDGHPDRTTNQAQLLHTFNTPGQYKVTVTAIDNRRGSSTAQATVEVGRQAPIFLSGGLGRISSIYLYKAAVGIPIAAKATVEVGYGQGEGQFLKAGYLLNVKLSAIEGYFLHHVTTTIFVGIGGGLLVIQGDYDIDWPVLGSDSFTHWVPIVGVKIGLQWGSLMLSVGVGFFVH